MNPGDRVWVAGHRGLYGSAIVRRLEKDGFRNLVLRDRAELDLLDQRAVREFFERERPEYVFFAAGKSGGIYSTTTMRADFIYEYTLMQCNVIHHAFLSGVKKLVFFACSSIYPREAQSPIKEEALLTSFLEPTCETFALAKIAGVKMCESYNRQYGTDFVSIVPSTTYGPNQNFDPMNAQALPALIRRFHEAKESGADKVLIWGTGRPARDFLYVDDLADAALFVMRNYTGNEIINIGTGRDYSIRELAEIIRREVGYEGEIVFDESRPDGVLKKLQDVSRLRALGWRHTVELEEGVRRTYRYYRDEYLPRRKSG